MTSKPSIRMSPKEVYASIWCVYWDTYTEIFIYNLIDQNTRPKILNIKEEKRYEL